MRVIYEDKHQLAYEKNGCRYSLMTNAHGVLVTQVLLISGEPLKPIEYWLTISDAIDLLKYEFSADEAVKFLRNLRERQSRANMFGSLRVFLKLIAHIAVAGVVGFIAGFSVRSFL